MRFLFSDLILTDFDLEEMMNFVRFPKLIDEKIPEDLPGEFLITSHLLQKCYLLSILVINNVLYISEMIPDEFDYDEMMDYLSMPEYLNPILSNFDMQNFHNSNPEIQIEHSNETLRPTVMLTAEYIINTYHEKRSKITDDENDLLKVVLLNNTVLNSTSVNSEELREI